MRTQNSKLRVQNSNQQILANIAQNSRNARYKALRDQGYVLFTESKSR